MPIQRAIQSPDTIIALQPGKSETSKRPGTLHVSVSGNARSNRFTVSCYGSNAIMSISKFVKLGWHQQIPKETETMKLAV